MQLERGHCPRASRGVVRRDGERVAYDGVNDDDDGDENGGLEIAALIRIRWTNEIIRK